LLVLTTQTAYGLSTPVLVPMKASVNIALTVDGFIATKDGGVDWLNEQPVAEGEDYGFQAFLSSVDIIVMGRNSFDKVMSFGPEAYAYGDTKLVVWTRDASQVVIPDFLKQKVACCTLPPKELLEKLAEDGYSHAYIDGAKTIQMFLEAGLIHSMCLTRIPILLGEGISLFGTQGQLGFKHIETKAYDNGFVTSIYDVLYPCGDCPAGREA
jgi:dihydrofolate reductase